MDALALNRRSRRDLNRRLGRPLNSPLKITNWKTEVVNEWEENGVKHNSHRHLFWITSVVENTHVHTHVTDDDSGGGGYCGEGINHNHVCTVNIGVDHNHIFSGWTGVTTASDLNHFHTIAIAASAAGSAHNHGLPANWEDGSCSADGCAADPHFHVAGGANANESTHTHGLNGLTGNGAGLLRWHTHPVNIECGAGTTHSHIVGTATIADANCHTGYLHDHNDGVQESSAESTHVHDVIGDTDEEGEPVDGFDELFARLEVGQGFQELLGELIVQRSTELLGRFIVQRSVELLARMRVSCPRRFGGNWQRKMWFDGTYYWRGRCDPAVHEIIFEYIAAAGLAGNIWTKNANASISCVGMAPDRIMADFTVRGGESGIPTTIHYSDGLDTWVAESDEASLIGWAWQNLTKVFDAQDPGDTYRKVNLGANRKATFPILWASAVFVDNSAGKQWVVTREQSVSGNIGGWNGEEDVSNVNNLLTVYGCSSRSMGAAGAEADDVMWVYKEGTAIRSRYYTGVAWQVIQDVALVTLSGRAAYDFEHGEVLGENEGHLVYVDADGSVKWKERNAGAVQAWSAAETLHGVAGHLDVGIVEHGAGFLWVAWTEGEDIIEFRLHGCVPPETWDPLLANPALTFDVATEAIITTSTARQLQTADWVPESEAVPICWIGETAPATPCEPAWGILREATIEDLLGRADITHSVELLGRADITHSEELLGRAVITRSIELFSKFEVLQNWENLLGRAIITRSEELLARAVITRAVELFSKFVVGQGGENLLARFQTGQQSAELFARFEAQDTVELLGRFVVAHWEELLGRAVITRSEELLARAIITRSVELLGRAIITRAEELLGRAIITRSVELLARLQLTSSEELLGRVEITHSVELLGRAIITRSVELLARAIITRSEELLGRVEITHSEELLAEAIIQQSGSAELLGRAVITHWERLLGRANITHSVELLARMEITHSEELFGRANITHSVELFATIIIRHTATPLNLFAMFWVRWPTRLWTTRRYINGVIDLDEKLEGDAILEYVIEGVMEDIQGYLDNASLGYSSWINIEEIPIQILRATTYGAVAALYARHTQTFRSHVIPSITPVTITVIGEAEKAMNYWDGRMNQMLDFYRASQAGAIMTSSTADEEPVFSMEDIPEEISEYVPWREWLQTRGRS